MCYAVSEKTLKSQQTKEYQKAKQRENLIFPCLFAVWWQLCKGQKTTWGVPLPCHHLPYILKQGLSSTQGSPSEPGFLSPQHRDSTMPVFAFSLNVGSRSQIRVLRLAQHVLH